MNGSATCVPEVCLNLYACIRLFSCRLCIVCQLYARNGQGRCRPSTGADNSQSCSAGTVRTSISLRALALHLGQQQLHGTANSVRAPGTEGSRRHLFCAGNFHALQLPVSMRQQGASKCHPP